MMFDLVSTGTFDLPLLPNSPVLSPVQLLIGFQDALARMGYGDLLHNLLPGCTPICDFDLPEKPTMLLYS